MSFFLNTTRQHYLLKVDDGNIIAICEICPKLTIKTPERHHWMHCHNCTAIAIIKTESTFDLMKSFTTAWSVQIRSYFWSVFSCIQSNTGKYGPQITPYLDTFHTVHPWPATYTLRDCIPSQSYNSEHTSAIQKACENKLILRYIYPGALRQNQLLLKNLPRIMGVSNIMRVSVSLRRCI